MVMWRIEIIGNMINGSKDEIDYGWREKKL